MHRWTDDEIRDLLTLSWLAPNYARISEEMTAKGWRARTSRAYESELLKIEPRGPSRRRRAPHYGRKSWSEAEDEMLMAVDPAKGGLDEISLELRRKGYRRSAGSIKRRIYTLRSMAPAAPIQGKPTLIPFSEAQPKEDAAVVNAQPPVHIAFSAQVFGIYLRHGRKIVTTVVERWEGRALRDLANARPDLLTVRLPEDPLTEDWVLEATFSKLFVESADSLLDYLTQTHPSFTVDQKKTA